MAVVRIPAASEPASGSVMAMEQVRSLPAAATSTRLLAQRMFHRSPPAGPRAGTRFEVRWSLDVRYEATDHATESRWRSCVSLGYARHMPRRRGDPQPEAPRRARLFRNGRNQALRIPRELEFPGDEVILHKEDDRLIVEPVARRRTLAEILPELKPLTEGLPEPADPPAQPEDIF